MKKQQNEVLVVLKMALEELKIHRHMSHLEYGATHTQAAKRTNDCPFIKKIKQTIKRAERN